MKKHIAPLLFLILISNVVCAQTANLVGNWKLDNNATDVSGNAYTGTLIGSPAFTTSNKEGTNALTLNGSTQYINLGNPALFPSGTSARTISAWAKSNTIGGGYRWIFAYGSATQSNAMFIGMAGADLRGGAYNSDLAQTNYWTTGVWHHICLTYDGTTAKLYADGTLLQSSAANWNLIPGKAYIGRQVSDIEYWNGSIDDVRIYNKALSASEVAAIATAPPAVPTALTATAASSSTINLTWTDNANNETGYQIERSLTTGTGFSLITTTAANATTYSDASLAAGTKYYYRIRSVNSGGNLAYSSEVNATTTGTVITAPSTLLVNLSSLTTANLSWTDNSANETGFQVERSLTSGTGYALVTTTATNTTNYSNTSLAENTTYYFRVRATNASGNSQYSNEVTITTSAVPPTTPSGLAATVVSGIVANLSWTDNSTNETGFLIERSVTTGVGFAQVGTTGVNATSYSDLSASANTTYFYRIRATNNGGNSSYTSEVSITTAVGGLVGQWKLNNNANDASGNNLTGTPANSPTYSTDSKEGSNSLVVNGTSQYINLGNPTILPSGLTPRTLCAWAKTTVTDNTPRSIATYGINWTTNAMYIGQNGTSLVAGGFNDDFTVPNMWTTNTWHHVCLTYDGTTAKLYFDGNQVASGAKTWSLNQSYAYIGRLFSDFENLWKGQIDDVRIYNKALSSTEVQAVITAGPIGPTALTATPVSSSTINLAWTDNSSNETGFLIERSTTSGTGYSQVGTVLANVTTFKDVSLAVGVNYYYRVRAYNAGGNSIYTTEYSISIPATPPVAQGLVWDDVEFNALKDLFTSTNGASWTTKTNWPTTWPTTATSTQFATWFGVTVTNGDVTSIDLSNNNLSGTLLSSVGLFNKLTSLNVRTNQITGTIPAEINNLTNLIFLSLGPNQFTGDIPNLGSLVNLTSFEISVVPVNPGPIPSWIANFTNLQSLILTDSKRTGAIPAFVWNLVALRSLHLDTNQLTGSISSSIGNLVNLTGITITSNQLSGSIPNEIGNLHEVQALEFYGNNLSGSLPTSLGNLNKLMYLYLWNNALTGSIPQEIRNCTALRELILGTNQLSGTIPDLSNIVALNYLGLDHNQFTGAVPDWIGNTNSLWNLFLNNNQFTGQLPASITRLPNLLNLIINDNQLSGVFPDVTSATVLQNIAASNNLFTDMPAGILGLQHLTVLKFDNNELKSIPDFSSQANKANLLLYVYNNRLDFSNLEPVLSSGVSGMNYQPQKNIHDFIYLGHGTTGSLVIQARTPGQHSSIITWEKQQANGSWLNVNSSNQDATQKTFTRTSVSVADDGVYRWSMTDTLFPGFTLQSDPITVGGQGMVADQDEFNALKDLFMSTTGSGWTNKTNWPTTWPATATSAEFGTWFGVTVTNSDVTSISVSNNNLIGTIPASLSNMQMLKYIFMHVNRGISGTIPSTLGNLNVLEQLFLNQCSLTGTIPPEIFNIPVLTFLDLGDNQLSGTIPSTIGNATQLYNLGLGSNNLTGSIPPSIGNLTNLAGLALMNNNFSGSIPSSIGNLTKLSSLYFHYNQFTGPIPPELNNLTELVYLSVAQNQFSGPIPDLSNLTKLQHFGLGYNPLNTTIPASIGNLTALIDLSIDGAGLTGSIPSSIGNLVNLTNLTLTGNQLSGPLPSTIGNLVNLNYIAINDNQLSGSIPESIGNLTNVRYLYFYHNQFSGQLPSTLGNLVNVAYLRFEQNQLTGPLPDLSRLTLLAQLIVNYNQLSGPILASNFSSAMVDFQIAANHFSGTFPDISNWPNINDIGISQNNFTGAFPSVNNQNLAQISAAYNQFTSVPTSILNIPHPGLNTGVDFRNNNITSITNLITDYSAGAIHPSTALDLYLDNNQLDFSQLEILKSLTIHTLSITPQNAINDFTYVNYNNGNFTIYARNPGQHSSTVLWEKQQANGSWLNVNAINQDATQQTFMRTSAPTTDQGVYRWSVTDTLFPGFTLQSVPITVGNQGLVGDQDEFNALKDLFMSTNGSGWTNKTNWPTSWPASATIAEFGTWFGIGVENGDVTSIWMDGNNLNGPLPASFSKLKALKQISFRGDNLSGPFSTFLPLTNLEYLDILLNPISGQLTEDFGNLTHLQFVYLGRNQLDGPIPSSIGNLTSLYFLALFGNNFTGQLPNSLANLTNLQRFYIHETKIEGQLPELFGNLTQLTDFWCYRTNLTGLLPESLGNCTSLANVYMYSNNFSGPLPENWKHLVNLQNLWIHFTSISGDVPFWLGDLKSLVSLSIGDTHLSGTIPPSLKDATNLSTLYMERLSLQGSIPDLSALHNLTITDLKFSHLTGKIPSSLMSIPTMRQFILNDNDFTQLPDLSSRTDKGSLIINIENNEIPVDDIERYFTAPGVHPFSVFTYSPQKNINLVSRIDIPEHSEFRIQAPSGGTHGTILWERLVNGNWQNVNSLNQSSQPYGYGIADATTAVTGTYRYTVTNSWVGMSFASGPITVEIGDALTASGGVKRLYNGLITAARWHTDKAYQTNEQDYEGMYVYDYDEKYQLKDASWADVDNSLDHFTMAANKFRTTAMSYDPNGNILALHRFDQNGMRTNNFTYHYQNSMANGTVTADPTQTNKLLKVDGYVNAYTYNALGQMTSADKETGEDQYVDYDVTGKVTAVYADAGKTQTRVKYIYDDRGFRLAKQAYDSLNNLVRTTWYIRDVGGSILSVYEEDNSKESGDDHSKITQTEVPIYGASKLGTFYVQQDSSTVYEITDHLGNVRALLRDNINIYTATMEDSGQPEITNPRVQENGFFENIFETEKSPTGPWLNHTPASTIVPHPNVAAYLDGSSERTIGPAITLKTNAGDVFDMRVYGKFEESGSYNSTIPLASIISELTGTFAFTAGLESISAASSAFTGGFAAIGAYGNNDNNRPRAFLNYILFDKNMSYISSGFDQINSGAGFVHNQENTVDFDSLKLEVRAPQDGFIYVYVSNETPGTAVWFDDLTVTHTGVMVTQSTDYEAWGNVLREQKADESTYRFGYQGQFSEKDLETGWNHFELREYDPVVSRWTSKDSKKQYYSPYIGMGNNPVNGIDPDGGFKVPVHQRIIRNAAQGLYSEADIAYMEKGVAYADEASIAGLADHSSYLHFDGLKTYSAIIRNYDLIQNNISRVMESPTGNVFHLAFYTHAIQDFYAHSNYIELYQEYFGKDMELTTFAEVINEPTQYFDQFKDFLSERLITGEFNLAAEIFGNRAWAEKLFGYKYEETHAYLNKDNANTEAGKAAEQLATKESRMILERNLKE